MPFYYASLSSLKVYYVVEAAALVPFLKGTTLEVARFDGLGEGVGVVSAEFQNYTGHGGTLLETCNEIEFNVLSYPASRRATVPLVSLEDFIKGMEQTKTIGGFRIFVPCDNPFAIRAGREVFGEAKFAATFDFKLPSLNLPEQKTWSYSVYDVPPADAAPGSKTPGREHLIYTQTADLESLPSDNNGNPSSIVLYSMFPELPNGGVAGANGYSGQRLIGSLWNIFNVDRVYKLDKAGQEKVRIDFGTSPHPMRTDVQKIIGSAPPVYVQVYQSDPAAVENRAFYVDPE